MVKSSMKRFPMRLLAHLCRRSNHRTSQQGFTLLEVIVVVLMLGIVAGIAAPGWLAYVTRREVVTTQDNVFTTIRGVQVKAQQKRQSYQFSIRENGGVVEWAVHSADITAADINNILWVEAPASRVEINTQTNLPQDAVFLPSQVYYIRFDYNGNVLDNAVGQQLTFSSDNTPATGADDATAKSIVVETLLGAMRKE